MAKQEQNIVYLYCDGACRGNPGPGGWGVLLRYNQHERQLHGGVANTTNNQMELTAAIEGLKYVKKTVPSGCNNRFAIFAPWDHRMASRLEKTRVANQ